MGSREEVYYVFAVLLFFDQYLPTNLQQGLKSPQCDEAHYTLTQEGNIGQTAMFPWLGILRVHLHEFDQLKIAVTGLVLVKDQYAIANADDISRVPKLIFMQDSKAMFIAAPDQPWFTKPKDYMVHPEYEYSTYNTIALVELETQVPFKPICWPGYFFNTSNQLCALGFTDENKVMEKMVYSLQYVKPSLCNEFYNRVGITEPKTAPTYVQCGFAPNNKKDCVWENGMALASNASGKWTLIGFGVRGPGCSAPARFIDMSAYLPWIESATDLEQINDYPDFRRKSAFDIGFGNKSKKRKSRTTTEETHVYREKYSGPVIPLEKKRVGIFKLEPGQDVWYEMPPYLTQAGFKYDDCSRPKILVYREKMRLVDSQRNPGQIEYMVTLIDKHIRNFTCLKLRLKNEISRGPVYIWMRKDSGSYVISDEDTPPELLRYYPLRDPLHTTTEATNDTAWKPGPHLVATSVVDRANYTGNLNINIVLGFTYSGEVSVEMSLFGYPKPRFPRRTTTSFTTSAEDERTTEPFWNRPLRKKLSFEQPKVMRMRRRNRLEKAKERHEDRKREVRRMMGH